MSTLKVILWLGIIVLMIPLLGSLIAPSASVSFITFRNTFIETSKESILHALIGVLFISLSLCGLSPQSKCEESIHTNAEFHGEKIGFKFISFFKGKYLGGVFYELERDDPAIQEKFLVPEKCDVGISLNQGELFANGVNLKCLPSDQYVLISPRFPGTYKLIKIERSRFTQEEPRVPHWEQVAPDLVGELAKAESVK